MRIGHLAGASIVVAATAIGATWLYSYQAPVVVTYVDRRGVQFHPPQRFLEQPWWAPPAMVVLVVIGVVAIVLVIPERRKVIRWFTGQFGLAMPRQRPRRDANGSGCG